MVRGRGRKGGMRDLQGEKKKRARGSVKESAYRLEGRARCAKNDPMLFDQPKAPNVFIGAKREK